MRATWKMPSSAPEKTSPTPHRHPTKVEPAKVGVKGPLIPDMSMSTLRKTPVQEQAKPVETPAQVQEVLEPKEEAPEVQEEQEVEAPAQEMAKETTAPETSSEEVAQEPAKGRKNARGNR